MVVSRRLVLLSLTVIALLLTACTSLVDKGDKLYAAGNFQEAADFYERALHKDPNNVEARIALKQARVKIIDKELINVRMLRLGSNMEGAATKLESILRNQKSWGVSAQGAVAGTQSEETRFAKPWLQAQLETLAAHDKPDKFRWFTHSYEQLINASQLNSLKSKLFRSVQVKGAEQCQALAREVGGQRHFLKEFSRSYCRAWNTDVRLVVSNVDLSRFRGATFRDFVAVNNHRHGGGLHSTLQRQQDALKQAFRDSIWYSSLGSNRLVINVSGDIEYQRRRSRVKRRASYVEKSGVSSKDATGKTITEEIKEKKTHNYWVTTFFETLQIDLKLDTTVMTSQVSRYRQESISNSTEAHQERFPPADLAPQSPNFMDQKKRLNQELQKLNDDFLRALTEEWSARYCSSESSTGETESLLRCAATEGDNESVNLWFEAKYGISYLQMRELYRL